MVGEGVLFYNNTLRRTNQSPMEATLISSEGSDPNVLDTSQ